MTTNTLTVRVPSQSVSGREYTLHVCNEVVSCNCPGYTNYHHCKHQQGVERIMAEEHNGTTALAQRSDAPPIDLVVGPAPTAVLPDRETLALIDYISGTVMRAGGGMVPESIKTKEQAAAIMLAGWEMGLRPMTSLRHVYLVRGKTQLEARAMMGVVRAADPRIRFQVTEYTQQAVTIQMHRPGQPQATEVRYTVDDAKKSGQYAKGGPWASYTRDMLYAAAAARVCRIGAPDLINAIDSRMPTVEETGEAMRVHNIVDGEVVQLAAHPATAPAGIPADAYNEGDDGAMPVEVQPPTSIDQRKRLRDLLTEAKGTTDAAFFTKMIAGIREAFPAAHTATTLLINKLSDEQVVHLADGVDHMIHGDGPPAQEPPSAPAEAGQQAELVTDEAIA